MMKLMAGDSLTDELITEHLEMIVSPSSIISFGWLVGVGVGSGVGSIRPSAWTKIQLCVKIEVARAHTTWTMGIL